MTLPTALRQSFREAYRHDFGEHPAEEDVDRLVMTMLDAVGFALLPLSEARRNHALPRRLDDNHHKRDDEHNKP